jgi:hypothetical protein
MGKRHRDSEEEESKHRKKGKKKNKRKNHKKRAQDYCSSTVRRTHAFAPS